MKIDPAALDVQAVYRTLIALIVPRPIAWVSTLSPGGVPNLAPFSFFNGVGANPPTLVFSVVNRRDGSKKDTIVNIEALPEFVVNVASCDLAVPMNATSEELPCEVSEFEAVGLALGPSEKIRPPRVKEAKAYFECVLHDIVRVGSGPLAANLVIGRIVLIGVQDAVLDPAGAIDAGKLDAIGRMGGDVYARTTDRFSLPRPGRKPVGGS